METVPTENMEVDEEGRQVSQYCLGLSTILRQILKDFSTKELLQLSLVNKQWNYEARSLMRNRGNVRANCSRGGDDEDDPCQKLVTFASDLEKMPVVPFVGIHIEMHHAFTSRSQFCEPNSKGSLHPSYKVILDLLPWKLFSVRFGDVWKDCKDCPGLVLVKKILEDHCGALEELTLGYGNEEFYQNIFQDRTFPCLKTLKIEPGDSRSFDEYLTSDFIKTLVPCAPNLQKLYVNRAINLMVNIMEGSSAVLVPDYRFRPMFEPICQGLIGSIQAEFLKMRIQTDEVDPRLLNTFIPMVIQASRTTLKTLFMDLLFARPLISYGICFENLTTLEIIMNGYTLEECAEPAILALVKGLDLTRIFPKLTEVTIMDDYDRDFSSDIVGAFVERGNEALRNATPDRAVNIKLLKFYEFRSFQDSTLTLLAQIFPDVKTIDFNRKRKFPLAVLRQHFRCLEEVTESNIELY